MTGSQEIQTIEKQTLQSKKNQLQYLHVIIDNLLTIELENNKIVHKLATAKRTQLKFSLNLRVHCEIVRG